MPVLELDYQKKHEILYCGVPLEILEEVKQTLSLTGKGLDFAELDEVFADIVKLFNGEYPGYKASNTKYHNLDHTCAVFLAQARLTHGMVANGHDFSCRSIELGLLASLFHDTGLIQEAGDNNGTGAKYMIGHEERSILLMGNYLSGRGRSSEDIDDCARIIRCTVLSGSPSGIDFSSPEIRLIGYILGTVDLLAQMSERAYLEKLSLLFMEFQEGGVPGYESSFDLYKKTEDFYNFVSAKKLIEDYDSVADNMRRHFKVRWNLNVDLYAEAITNQITYLQKIKEEHSDSYKNFREKLRRK